MKIRKNSIEPMFPLSLTVFNPDRWTLEFRREEFFSAGVCQEEFLGAKDQLWWLTPRHLKIRKSVN